MQKLFLVLERSSAEENYGLKIAFSWSLRHYYVSCVAPNSLASLKGIRVGDVISSISSLCIDKLGVLKKKLNKIEKKTEKERVKKLYLNFKKRDFQTEECFYSYLSNNRKILLSLRRYDSRSDNAILLSFDMRAPIGGGQSSDSSDSDAVNSDNNDAFSLITNGSDTLLSFEKYHELLSYAEEHPELLSQQVAIRPRGGSIILYDYSNQEINGIFHDEKKTRENFRCDQYRFGVNRGEKAVGRHVRVKRAFYYLYDPEIRNGRPEFRRLEVRKCNSDKKIMLFHYTGDTDLAVQVANKFPHGNSKYNQNPFIRTKPFVQAKILQQKSFAQTPHQLYMNLQGETELGPQSATDLPRNTEQVRNTMKRDRAEFRVTRDSIYNLILLEPLLVLKDEKFIGNFTVPRLNIPLYPKPLLMELERVLKMSQKPIELFYDTVFDMGPYYVSILSFRHPFFVGNPVFGAAYLIHERKFNEDHMSFLHTVKKYCPSLERERTVIVTDQEFDLELLWANTTHFFCWVHLKNATKRHLSVTLHLPTGDYIADLELLLAQETNVQFDTAWIEAKRQKHWLAAPEAVAYFETHVIPIVKQKCAIWVLQKGGVENPSAGVTTNPAESYNAILHRVTDHKAVPHDVCVLTLYYLSIYQWREITRAYHRQGDMQLKQCYLVNLAKDSTDMPTIPACPPLTSIIDACLKEVEDGKWGEWSKEVDDVAHDSRLTGSLTTKQKRRQPLHAVALQLHQLGKLSANVDKTFTVKDLEDHAHVVQVKFHRSIAKFRCSCNPTKECVHIMVVKLQLNMELNDEVGNSTEEKRRRKPVAQRRPGQKAPRIGDNPNDRQKTVNEKTRTVSDNNDPGAATHNPPNSLSTPPPSSPQSQMPPPTDHQSTPQPDVPLPTARCVDLSVYPWFTAALTSITKKFPQQLSSFQLLKPTRRNPVPAGLDTYHVVQNCAGELAFIYSRNDPDHVHYATTFQNCEMREFAYHAACSIRETKSTSVKVTKDACQSDEDAEYALALFILVLTASLQNLTINNLHFSNDSIAHVINNPTTFIDNSDLIKGAPGKVFIGKNTTSILLYCCCRMPHLSFNDYRDAELQLDDMCKCEKCKKWYFRTCLDIPKNYFPKYDKKNQPNKKRIAWLCKSCYFISAPKAPRWFSKSATNTCTIDNILTIIFIYAQQHHPSFLRLLGSETTSERALRECLMHMIVGHLSEGKEKLLHFIGSRINVPRIIDPETKVKILDFWGSENCFLLEVLQLDQVFTALEVTECNSEQCPKPTSTARRSTYSIQVRTQSTDKDIAELIERAFRGMDRNTVASCRRPFPNDIAPSGSPIEFDDKPVVNLMGDGADGYEERKEVPVCGGKRAMTDFKFENERPWMLPIFLHGMPVSRITELPQTITIANGTRYRLGGVTLHSNKHFTSLIFIENSWFLYDGLNHNGSESELVSFSFNPDTDGQVLQRLVQHAIYLIDC